MPLRDHFHSPVFEQVSWEGFHGQWPAMIVQRLFRVLPGNYIAEPRAHLGANFEIDVSAYTTGPDVPMNPSEPNGGVATATWTATEPVLEVEGEWPDQYEYAVLVFDQTRARRLVAAVELVSPANKDRPESRRAFVTKCAALLQQGVALVIVNLVTVRHFNLYAELLELIGQPAAAAAAEKASAYAAAVRFRPGPPRSALQTWPCILEVGKHLPTLPLWLSPELAVPLDLEAGYEDACRLFRIV